MSLALILDLDTSPWMLYCEIMFVTQSSFHLFPDNDMRLLFNPLYSYFMQSTEFM